MAYFFAREHATMTSKERKPCDMISNDFRDGITNGANWYPVCGGMQDYNYLSSNCFELTIELGCDKFPPGKELKKYWQDNVDSFYEYIWLVSVHPLVQ
jgi:carboxypeptidase E